MKLCPVSWTSVLGALALTVCCGCSASSSSLSSSSSSGSARQMQGHLIPPLASASEVSKFFKQSHLPKNFWIYRKKYDDEDGDVTQSDFEDPDLMDFHENSKRQYDDYGHLRFGKRAQDDYDYGHMRFGRSLPSSKIHAQDKKRAA